MKHPIIITSGGKFSTYSEYKNGIIAKAVFSPAGKIALAQAMAAPIKRNLDYQGMARRVLVADQLPTVTALMYENLCRR